MKETLEIRRIKIWSGWLRLAHGALALSTLLLMTSGWLIQHTIGVENLSRDIHYGIAGLFVVALLSRLGLLFWEKTSGNWRALWPHQISLEGIKQTALFYLSFGRSKLPSWHAHNPLWIPLYAFMLIVMLICTLSGVLMESTPVLFGTLYVPELHSTATNWFSVLVIAHIITAIWHDCKSDNSNISAMLNGYRIFLLEKPQKDSGTHVIKFQTNPAKKTKQNAQE